MKMEKKNNDFMGKVKEFFRPNKWKLFIFVIIIFFRIFIGFVRRLSCFGGHCEVPKSAILLEDLMTPSRLIYQLVPEEFLFIYFFVDFVCLYIISCIFYWIIIKLKSNDFMEKVKDFLRPTKGKLIVFGVLFLFRVFIRVMGFTPHDTAWLIISRKLIFPSRSIYPLIPQDFLIVYWLIDIVYLYLIASIVYWIINIVKKHEKS